MDSKLIRGGSTFFAQAPRRLKAVPTPKAPAQLSTPEQSKSHSYPGDPNFAPAGFIATSLIELNPYRQCTLNMATSRAAAIGTLLSGTSAPSKHREAAHQLCHDGQPRHQVRGRHSQNVKDGGERLGPFEELGIPCSMKPNPTIRRNGIGAQVAPATHS
jgi:hypothetical protein